MEPLKLAIDEGGVATITIARPPANALSRRVLEQLDHILTQVEKDDHVRVILLHGEGRFFAAGADIKEFLQVKDGSEFAELAKQGQRLFDRMEAFSKPIIAAIHGAALGGGLELAMACHIRLATEDTKLGLPELQLGLIPGFAGSQRLPRLVGRAKALEMMLTSEPITGSEAKTLGLINSLHSEQTLIDDAKALAKKIAAKSLITTAMVLELVQYACDDKFVEGSEREAELFGKAFDSADGKEGIQAFLEKRKPNFNDQ
ncbi:enoyl-CoA hydratase [Halalkalibacterium halodurans]|uniref:Enoyl-CoA hydratase(3-hydroxybutyryl-CoA dehydratase) n=2 Tax=Halalkalibacterium halodurans TaxID=86665 RepID=Q9K8A5_HALH5|nr:enoyl-CoA hydratase [Halalkalibacterium halodurans]MED4082084.1 enoyl-CoA hydratase [Halalkalibacterium halodurans]MED4084338.1 enoyl-CoA hydratase [Halalkalibacterium halodurans]MED4103647.1 enoyl-CoA hydratase [Halalkalibacterium halodurans]MED4107614.1 enoyl-CoA hydratase [Halalkalibacterium halodurans]MED4149063.1 enoyl-CoA hydratase [Halalkalibacterium halodurans]